VIHTHLVAHVQGDYLLCTAIPIYIFCGTIHVDHVVLSAMRIYLTRSMFENNLTVIFRLVAREKSDAQQGITHGRPQPAFHVESSQKGDPYVGRIRRASVLTRWRRKRTTPTPRCSLRRGGTMANHVWSLHPGREGKKSDSLSPTAPDGQSIKRICGPTQGLRPQIKTCAPSARQKA
jgi:hypothetical protein